MSRAAAARRIAAAAAFGGGGLGVIGASAWGVLAVQAVLARRLIGEPTEQPLDSDGVYGVSPSADAEEIRVVVLGDSSAAGLGADAPDETPGALLAAGLAALTNRPVRLRTLAAVGADSRTLLDQLEAAMVVEPHLALIMIGANDVTHRLRPSESCRFLAETVSRLVRAGTAVVVGTCPDLGTIEPIPHPLRYIARRWSRQLAAAQTVAVVAAGGRTVSLSSILGPEFAADPKGLFGPDRFHPSAAGYAAAGAALLPSVASALGVLDSIDEEPEPVRGDEVLPVAVAAAQAAERPGVEVSGAHLQGRERGPAGRWVLLRNRRRPPLPNVLRQE